MYEKILNVVYYYSFNYKLPDKDFVMSIVNIILSNRRLTDYVKNINFDYDGIAGYKYISKELSFSISSIINTSTEDYNSIKEGSKYQYEKYLYLCFSFIETIFHEFEHIRQVKKLDTGSFDCFEKKIINNNIKNISINPGVYRKEHNLFTIERLAILKSQLEVLDIVNLDSSLPTYIVKKYINYYNYFVELDYRKDTYPLLKYVEKTNSSIYYDNILINRENTNKLLKKTKRELSEKDRLLYGFPINREEYINILDKSLN